MILNLCCAHTDHILLKFQNGRKVVFRRGQWRRCEGVGTVDLLSPISIFRLFFNRIIIDNVYQSNLYAKQNNRSLEFTTDGLLASIGIIIIMGFHKLPSLRLYWSQNPNFSTQCVNSVLTLKRILKILRNIHINDNFKMPKPGDDNFD